MTLYEYQTESNGVWNIHYDQGREAGQVFKVGNVGSNEDFNISTVEVYGDKDGSPSEPLEFYIKEGSTHTGSVVCSGSIAPENFSESNDWNVCTMSAAVISASTTYFLHLKTTGGDSSNDYNLGINNGNPYTGSGLIFKYSNDTGSTWNDHTDYDATFKINGSSTGGSTFNESITSSMALADSLSTQKVEGGSGYDCSGSDNSSLSDSVSIANIGNLNPVAGKNTFWVKNGSLWTEFNQVEFFKVRKRQNQINEFEVKLFDVTTAQKDFFKEQAEVLFFSGTTMILKGRIQTIEYGDEFLVIARGFGKESLLMDKQLQVIGRIKKEDGDFLLTENENKILFLRENRVGYSDFSAKEIATELNSNILTTASSGIFSSDYGNVSISFEYTNRLKAIADLAQTIDFDWWVSQTSSDNYEEDFLNLAPIRGNTSSQKTYNPTTNASFTSQERDITNLSNFVRILGYGDGVNQLETTTYEASTQSSILNLNIESTNTSIELLDASDFDATGTARIAEEQIVYAGISSDTLTGCTRGTNSTTARNHLKNCYIEQFFDRDTPQTGSSIQVHGLMEDILIDKTLQDIGGAELIGTKRLLERKDPIRRITILPDEPFEDVASLDIGDKITITSSESDINDDFRIVGINYLDNFGELGLELEVSNRNLEFMEQVRKQREEEQNLGKYMQGATNLYIMNVSENCDEENPLNLRFFIPSKATTINKIFLSFQLENFRFSDAGGITEEILLNPSVIIQVGREGSESTFGTFTTDQEEINITDFVTESKGWYNVKFTPNKNMRIESNLSVQLFLESK